MIEFFEPRLYLRAFRASASLLSKHRYLFWELTKRELADPYQGHFLGAFWAIGHPLILIGTYVFVFGFVFQTRIGGSAEMPLNYTTYLLGGLIPWLTFQEAMTRGVVVILNNAGLVKQVVFPIELLPARCAVVALLTQMVYTVALIIYVVVTQKTLPSTYLLLPVLLLLQTMAMMGVCYALAAVGVFLHDLKDILRVFLMVGLYFLPIIYLPAWIPRMFKPLLYLNPWSYLVWCYQDVCSFGRFEHPWAWPAFVLLSVLVFGGGYHLFQRMKPFFGGAL